MTRQESYDRKIKFKEAPGFGHTGVLSDGQWQAWIESGKNYAFIGLEGGDAEFEPTGRWLHKEYTCPHANKVALRHEEHDITVDVEGETRNAIEHRHILLDKDGNVLSTAITKKIYSDPRWRRIKRIRREKLFELLEASALHFGLDSELEIIYTAFVIEKLTYISAGPHADGSSALKAAVADALVNGSQELKDALNVISPNPAHGGLALHAIITMLI